MCSLFRPPIPYRYRCTRHSFLGFLLKISPANKLQMNYTPKLCVGIYLDLWVMYHLSVAQSVTCNCRVINTRSLGERVEGSDPGLIGVNAAEFWKV